jgi:addiction module RelB/DinJ family antitoxin
MSQTPLTIKIDSDVKHQAQKLAKGLGLSLSSIIENQLRKVVEERRVVFEEVIRPTPYLQKIIDEAEADHKASRNISGPFKTFDEVKQHLNTISSGS